MANQASTKAAKKAAKKAAAKKPVVVPDAVVTSDLPPTPRPESPSPTPVLTGEEAPAKGEETPLTTQSETGVIEPGEATPPPASTAPTDNAPSDSAESEGSNSADGADGSDSDEEPLPLPSMNRVDEDGGSMPLAKSFSVPAGRPSGMPRYVLPQPPDLRTKKKAKKK